MQQVRLEVAGQLSTPIKMGNRQVPFLAERQSRKL